MKRKVAVLMATYNGEKYLRDQIDSIVFQTFKDWELYIHDDGSEDSTVSIIEEYCEKYDNIFCLEDDEKHRGPEGSFAFLLRNVDAPFYMFADQDDYWYPDKIEKSYEKICELEKDDIPALIATNHDVSDKDLNLLYTFSNIKSNLFSNKDLMRANSYFPGCTMFFNKKLRDLYDREDNPFLILHDHKIALLTLKHDGKFFYINEPLIKYRQHDSNVIGSSVRIKSDYNGIERIKRMCKIWWAHYKVRKFYLNQSLMKYIVFYLKGKFLFLYDRIKNREEAGFN